jgi:epoxyqueuosine reductase
MPSPGNNPADLAALFDLDEGAFRARFRHSPLWRPKRRGLLRNAAVVLGNQRYLPALPALTRGLNDTEALVRGACAWALGQLNGDAAHVALQDRLDSEDDPQVLHEIAEALRLRASHW